jgi:ribonuclease Z
MKPSYHPQLVNGEWGDPALYVEFMFERRAVLFDLGDLTALPSRKILRISDVFVSHTHMDHFIGFDHLLRTLVGRDKRVSLYGPPGLIDQAAHKLGGYTWNLVENYEADFILTVMEVHPDGGARRARFSCRAGFRREAEQDGIEIRDGVLLREANLQVRCAVLDHKIPCLAFALEEGRHVNVWKNHLLERGLLTGPWLQSLKRAALRGDPDETLIAVPATSGGNRSIPLGELKRDILRIVPGQKIGYVVDTLYNEDNARRITELVRGADQLFIEAPFLQQDAAHAAARYHLTAHQAGTLARRAGVKHCIPCHFSARYSGQEDKLAAEALSAFHGESTPAPED